MSTETQTTGQAASLLNELVGPEKKFKTVEDLVKGKLEADSFIETLKQENAALRLRTDEQATIKELMESFRKESTEKKDSATTPSDAELQEKFQTFITQREASRTKAVNREEAIKLVSQRVNGDKAGVDAYLEAKAKELGMSKDALLSLSEQSVQGFAAMIGLETKRTIPGTSTALPHATNPSETNNRPMEIDGHKTKAWFDAKRKEMGTRKFINSSQMQIEILKARDALGERFYS